MTETPNTFKHPGQKYSQPIQVIHSPCRKPALQAWIAGSLSYIDPQPLDTIGELLARSQHRAIFQTLRLGWTWNLTPRTAITIQHSNPDHVLAEHHCQHSTHQPPPQLWPAPTRKDDTECPY